MSISPPSIADPQRPSLPDPVADGHLLQLLTGGLPTPSTPAAARATRRRADRYRRFLDALGVAVYTTDRDGSITFFNAGASCSAD